MNCRFTKDYEKHKDTIAKWSEDECMAIDESCMMAEETMQELDYIVNPSPDTLSYYKEDYEASKKKITNVRLIECEGELAGFFKYKDYFPEEGLKVIYAEELFIHPDKRKGGIGLWAVKEAFDESGADRMVGTSLPQAQDFWRGIGAWMNPIEILGKRTFAIDIERD